MQIVPYLMAQNDLLVGIKQRMRDADGQRWTATEIYNSLNDGIRIWARKVTVPLLYTITNGFVSGVYEYSLPVYIREPMDVQLKRYLIQTLDGLPVRSTSLGASTWEDVPGYNLEPDGDGGQKLRLDVTIGATEGRVIWHAQNGTVPTSVQTLSADITDTATSLTLASNPLIGDAGYIKIESEWIAYGGYSVGATTTTLTNLVRGVNETTAASHTAATNVYFGIAAHRQDLFEQLINQVTAKLHALFLTNASPQETEHHVFQVRYYQQLADEFWQRYTPQRGAKMKLTRQGKGRP
jgi:hypothetical protein